VWAYVCGAWFINVRYLFTKRKKRAIYDSFLAYKSIQHFNRLKDQRSNPNQTDIQSFNILLCNKGLKKCKYCQYHVSREQKM